MKILLWTLMMLSSFGWAVSYSDGTTTNGWRVYDNTPAGASITLNNGAIQLTGDTSRNGYILGDKRANRAESWDNYDQKILRFKMNYNEELTMYLVVNTPSGIRYLIYNTEDNDSPENLETGIGSDLIDGTWHTVERNVTEDLQKFEPANEVVSIEGIIVRGSGLLDDIELVGEAVVNVTTPTEYNGTWSVFDNTPAGATISTVDGVTHLDGNLTRNSYMLGNKASGRDGAWNNRHQKILTFEMNYDEDFVLYVFVETDAGNKVLTYTATDANASAGMIIGLGSDLIDGTWKNVTRNLERDLQNFESGNNIRSVHGIIVRGSGLIKNVTLNSEVDDVVVPPVSSGDIVIPGYDYSAQTDYYDTTAHGAWALYANRYGFVLTQEENAYVVKTVDDLALGRRDGYVTKMNSKRFNLDPTKRYQAVIRMKAKSYPLGQNILVTVRGPRGDKGKTKFESNWNVSSSDWEEITLVLDPTTIENAYGNEWYFQFMASTAYKGYVPADASDVLIDENIDVFEIPSGRIMVSTKDINLSNDKKEYLSSHRKIDALGNFYVEENASWKHIFPKMIYKDSNFNDGEAESIELFRRYKDYGFNGVANIVTQRQMEELIKYGLTNIGLEVSPLNRQGLPVDYVSVVNRLNIMHSGIDTLGVEKNVLWYNMDNENHNIPGHEYHDWLANYMNTNRVDAQTGKRAYPIFYLNGQYGLTRTYNNSYRDVFDVTGSYIGGDVNGRDKDGKKDIKYRLASQFFTENQKAPASVIHLQKHFTTKFIPSLFFGIIQGGRALTVWRDGEPANNTKPQLIGVPNDFRDNVWADAFRDEVSGRLDTMLPIIKTPQFTTWTATTDVYPEVRMGTREADGKGYLILANFADEDKTVTVTLDGFTASTARDFFTGNNITVNGNTLTFSIGHHNQGYKVIELVR